MIKEDLHDRAKRAKMHVRRKYGSSSPEYKALVNKNTKLPKAVQ
jgi:hypothetical protein